MMWATFFATGNVEYPRRLIDLLDESAPITGDKVMDAVLRQTVAWSLSSNMRQHELILRMVKSESALRAGPVQQKLNEMLATLQSETKPLPSCNGDFCAMLVLIPEDNLKQFDKPSDQGVFLTQMSKAKPGDHIAIKLVFAGMELGSDLSADVSYDVKITAPDGTLYTTEQLGLEALKKKVPLRFSMFDNGVLPIVRFEPKDARGAYTVSAEISDNIGHRKIALSQRVELTD
jgi:hypothetical protein